MRAAGDGPPRGGPEAAAFPWEGLFRAAVLRFGIAPSEVWRLTLKEIWVLLAPEDAGGAARMSRHRLARLMENFPDG